MFTDHGEIQKYRKLTENEKERGRILLNKRTTKENAVL